MIKFFRRHNKKLLAVFMTGLLVVWLGGSALQALLTPSTADRVIGTSSRLGEIQEMDQSLANFETDLILRLGIDWTRPWNLSGSNRPEPLGIIEWILLTREAEQFGMTVEQVEIDGFLDRLGATPSIVYGLAGRRDVKIEAIYTAVGKYLGMQRLIGLTASSVVRSEAAIRLQARNELEKVKINVVAVRAGAYSVFNESFSEEEIQAHFDEYRDREKGRGMNFGYFHPASVKVEYFKIDVDKVAANIPIGERTLERRAREHWRKNPNDSAFRRPPKPEPEPTDDEEAGGASDVASEPAAAESPFFDKFDEAREAAIKIVRRQFADREVENIASWIQRELAEPWFDAMEGEDQYKVAPEQVLLDGYFTSVLDRMPAKLRFVDAVSTTSTEFFDYQNAALVQDIGQAWALSGGGRRVLFRDLVFQVQGVATIPTDPGTDTSQFLAIGQPCGRVAVDWKGNVYLCRVIEVKPPGPAEHPDLVRDQILLDMRKARGFAAAHVAARKLKDSVTGDGLKAAFDADEELKQNLPNGFQSPPPFARGRKSFDAGINTPEITNVTRLGIVDTAFVEKCMALKDKPEYERVVVIDIKESEKVAVVEWIESLPMRVDQFEAQRGRLVAAVNRNTINRAVGQWLDPTRIRDRNGFAFAQR